MRKTGQEKETALMHLLHSAEESCILQYYGFWYGHLFFSSSHVGVKGNDPADRLAGKAANIQVACISEDLTCWGAWDTSCRRKAKDTMPSTDRKREAYEEETLDKLPWQDTNKLKGRSSIQGDIGGTSERQGGAHMGVSERIDATLK